jgi:hypothetical protein
VSAAAVVLWAAGVFAQAKPDFSGTWTVDAEKTTAAGGRAGRGGGGGFTLKQDATSLTMTSSREGSSPVVYKLDGSSVQVPGRGGAMMAAKATWEGNTIVITTTLDMGERKAVYAMEGEWLVVSTTSPGREGGAPTTNKVYYKKGM